MQSSKEHNVVNAQAIAKLSDQISEKIQQGLGGNFVILERPSATTPLLQFTTPFTNFLGRKIDLNLLLSPKGDPNDIMITDLGWTLSDAVLVNHQIRFYSVQELHNAEHLNDQQRLMTNQLLNLLRKNQLSDCFQNQHQQLYCYSNLDQLVDDLFAFLQALLEVNSFLNNLISQK